MRSNPFIGTVIGPAVYLDDFDPFVKNGQAIRATASHEIKNERITIKGGWALVKGYCGARKGQMIVATRAQGASTLSFNPGVPGRHAIYVCSFSKRGWKWWDGFGTFVKLNTEEHWTLLLNERVEPSFDEMYFKTVDLDSETKIEIANFESSEFPHPETAWRTETGIAHFELKTFLTCIKLVPVRAEKLPAPTKTTIGILDFADDVPLSHPRHLAAASSVRRHAEFGYNMIMWKAGNGAICEYHTKVGILRDDDTPVARLLKEYDVMRQAVEEARRIGIPIYGWSRLLRDPPTKDGVPPPTPFHAAHPEQVQTLKDGRQNWKLSFAFSDARRYMIDMLCEIAAYGMDGIFIDLLRHPPVVQYDVPLVEAFKAKKGQDPREMEGDGTEEWLRFRADAFTRFLRETRSALDKQASGKRYPLIVRTVDQPWRNLHIGCDVERWIEENLVDGILFAPHIPLGDKYPENIDLTPYLTMARGRTKIYGQVWRESSGMQAELLASDLYEQGVDGVALYESNLTVERPSMRERLWRFSRPDHLLR
ncbi:MAG: hypothetical protein HY360_16385 [Verrucomicrobia bacterium]|nr:hypothetical protein [Verrucomicrobiota bacterium]